MVASSIAIRCENGLPSPGGLPDPISLGLDHGLGVRWAGRKVAQEGEPLSNQRTLGRGC